MLFVLLGAKRDSQMYVQELSVELHMTIHAVGVLLSVQDELFQTLHAC